MVEVASLKSPQLFQFLCKLWMSSYVGIIRAQPFGKTRTQIILTATTYTLMRTFTEWFGGMPWRIFGWLASPEDPSSGLLYIQKHPCWHTAGKKQLRVPNSKPVCADKCHQLPPKHLIQPSPWKRNSPRSLFQSTALLSVNDCAIYYFKDIAFHLISCKWWFCLLFPSVISRLLTNHSMDKCMVVAVQHYPIHRLLPHS